MHLEQRHAAGIAAAYALVVVVVAVGVAVATREPGSFAGIWVLVVTLPGSLLALPTGLQGDAMLVLLTLLGLLQALVVYLLLARVAARRR
ncbi:SCO4225 family membrane protein [Motilibacter aurantiacus]|uniref:SCO4225 family membrane protein n=1 Tax=Motilibacter aurantiacus TaxID=2714955 RepID=UPI00140AF7D6|nr:hypothetical protein [Motilibacter aurantiacus]NHC47429.1 hypothetical protein [Motilibacter aurantiacus]